MSRISVALNVLPRNVKVNTPYVRARVRCFVPTLLARNGWLRVNLRDCALSRKDVFFPASSSSVLSKLLSLIFLFFFFFFDQTRCNVPTNRYNWKWNIRVLILLIERSSENALMKNDCAPFLNVITCNLHDEVFSSPLEIFRFNRLVIYLKEIEC